MRCLLAVLLPERAAGLWMQHLIFLGIVVWRRRRAESGCGVRNHAGSRFLAIEISVGFGGGSGGAGFQCDVIGFIRLQRPGGNHRQGF